METTNFRVCLELMVLLLDTLWIPGVVCTSDAVTPITAFNVTLSISVNSTSSGGVVGRAGVALGVAGVVGVAMYILRKKGPRGSHLSRRPQGPRREPASSRGRALLTANQSGSSVPLLQSNEESDLDPDDSDEATWT